LEKALCTSSRKPRILTAPMISNGDRHPYIEYFEDYNLNLLKNPDYEDTEIGQKGGFYNGLILRPTYNHRWIS
jgi:hypothetical protein